MKRRKWFSIELASSPKEAFSNAVRYFNNAKENLRKSSIKHNRYTDSKYVREASAMAYLAAIAAIDGALLRSGFRPKDLPHSMEEYFKAIKTLPLNGKLTAALWNVYDDLHIYGYYRGGCDAEVLKTAFARAKAIIEVLKGNNQGLN